MEELRWKTSVSATALHAAACRAAGLAAADPNRFAELAGPIDALIGEIDAVGWPVEDVLHELASQVLDLGSKRDAVQRLNLRLQLRDADAASYVRIAGAISDLEASLARSHPQAAEELAARIRPLREHWEARGPGLLTAVARLTDPAVTPSVAEIVLVLPYAGGHGVAHPAKNRVILEAMLINPQPDLPETLRIAWLLSQLNCDLPLLADILPPKSNRETCALAMAPAVLSAAEVVELAHCDQSSIAAALAAWRCKQQGPEVAEKLLSWWDAWKEQSVAWPVAVAALQKLVGQA